MANDAHVQLKVPEDQTYEVIYSGHLKTDQQGQYEFGSYSKPVVGACVASFPGRPGNEASACATYTV